MRGIKLLSMAGAVVACLLVAGAATAGSRSEASPNAAVPDTLIYAGAADPTYLDPALVSDGESFRVTKQIYESLVDFAPGTTRLVPGLAKSWSVAKDGRTYTFNLRGGVKFHDGTAFNAAAVCANFNRWYNFSGPFQDASATYYYQAIFSGFRRNENAAARQAALPELPGRRQAEGRRQAGAEERPVRSVARPLGVLDPESGRDGEVGREPGHDPQRRRSRRPGHTRSSIRPARARTGSRSGRSVSP